MRDAMIAGCNLNIFNNHCDRVKMANLAQIINVLQAVILTDEQKLLIVEKLSNRINNEGMLFVKSQTFRTQLENKDEVIRKINELVVKALEKKKKRKPTKISKAAKEKRLDGKKKKGDIKEGRRRVDPHNM